MRMVAIGERLRWARRPVTARHLAEALDVAPRTIYRDVAALQALHVPVLGEPGAGYRLGPGFDLPPLMLTAVELEAVRVGLALLARTGDAGLQGAARDAASKIAGAVTHGPVVADRDDDGLFASGHHAIPEAPVGAGELREHVREACALRIVYRDGASRRTERRVLPLALVYYVDSVVLAGWCALREDFRHFRADRLESCVPDGGRFARRCAELRRTWRARRGWEASAPTGGDRVPGRVPGVTTESGAASPAGASRPASWVRG